MICICPPVMDIIIMEAMEGMGGMVDMVDMADMVDMDTATDMEGITMGNLLMLVYVVCISELYLFYIIFNISDMEDMDMGMEVMDMAISNAISHIL